MKGITLQSAYAAVCPARTKLSTKQQVNKCLSVKWQNQQIQNQAEQRFQTKGKKSYFILVYALIMAVQALKANG